MSSHVPQTKGLERNTMDKFYTKRSISKICVKYVKKFVDINNNDLIIEPSAGNGSFIKYIKRLSEHYIFYDIEPEHNEIIQKDFLQINYHKLVDKYKNIHVIGNPPFGRQSSMAIKFIKKCCLFASSISFILPKSFKKDSMKKYFDPFYHMVFECDIDDNAFLINNIETSVPCVFQIWVKKIFKRPEIKILEPIGFMFVKKDESPHISFRRVGVNAGKISQSVSDKSTQSHYFIKFTNDLSIKKNIKKISNIHFESNNTVGPKSISKQEIIKIFNCII